MAIVQNPITGRTKNKFGSAVFAKQFGKNTMRTKPIEVKNPRTPDQVNQRNKFSLMIGTARSILDTLRVSFKSEAVKMTAFNSFVSNNIKTAIIGAPGNYEVDYPNLLVSKGSLVKPLNPVATSTVAATISRTWTPPLNSTDGANTDLLGCLNYNVDKNLWIAEITSTQRSAGICQEVVPANWSGDDVHTYTFFVNAKKNKSCDSVYTGIVNVL
jgi:hypothetical protein